MKIIAQILTMVLAVQLIVPARCFSQQRLDETIDQLRQEIAKLEEADRNPELPAEVRALNREFLAARKRQLNDTISKRIAAFRQYLTTMEPVLKPEERRAVENTIQNLSPELRDTNAQAAAKIVSVVEPRDPSPVNVVRSNLPIITPTIRPTFDSSTMIIPEARNYSSAPAKVPIPMMQDGSRAKREDFVINTSQVPAPKEVENGTVVTIKMSKSFVDVCTVTTKREELKPEPNPLAALLKIIIGLGPIALGKVTAPTCPTTKGEGIKIPDDPEARRIETELNAVRLRVVASVADVNEATMNYSDLGDKITAFTNCREVSLDREGKAILAKGEAKDEYQLKPICGSVDDFNNAKDKIRGQVEAVLVKPLPVIDSLELEMATLKKALTDYKKKGDDEETKWITDVSNRLDCSAKTLNQIKKELSTLQGSREQFESFLKLLGLHETKNTYERELIADANAKVTGTVACTNYFTKQPSFDPIPFTVTYQGHSRHALTAGILFTTLNKRQLGISSVRTGAGTDGTSTSQLTLIETDKADAQIVPFSFYNYRLWGGRKFSLNGSGGVGINPNNGATQVEFFFGGAVGFQNVFLQLGGHVGRWQEFGGGFQVGDVVPAVIPVPIERRYSVRPAVGVSYKLPLR